MPYYQYRTFGGHGQTVVWRDLGRFRQEPSLPGEAVGTMTYEDFREHYAAMMNPMDDERIYADVARFLGAK